MSTTRKVTRNKGEICQPTDDFEVTVVIATYHPDWGNFRETIQSIVMQEGISLQLILTDDGSEESYFTKAEEYLKANNFSNYKLVTHAQNSGTVKNVLDALRKAEGKYVKLISPGDYLKGKDVLRNWIDYLKDSGYNWSFANAIYYTRESGKKKILKHGTHPENLRPYRRDDIMQCRWNYFVFDDTAAAPAVVCRTDVLLDYLERICDKIIYLEDHAFRMMMFENNVGVYYPRDVVFYECGISTGNAYCDDWEKKVRADWNAMNEILLQNKADFDTFQTKMMDSRMKYAQYSTSKDRKRRFLVKGYLWFWLHLKLSRFIDS